MNVGSQERIIDVLDEKITQLKNILEEPIVKHSDAEYDLKDLKQTLKEINGDKVDNSSEKMLVMANEWEDVV